MLNANFIPPQEWQRRALIAERRLSDAMDCLLKMGDKLPYPWREVAQCAYIGCGGENHWKAGATEQAGDSK